MKSKAFWWGGVVAGFMTLLWLVTYQYASTFVTELIFSMSYWSTKVHRQEARYINNQHGHHCLQSIINHLSVFRLTLCLLNDVTAPVWELSHVCVLTCKLVSQSLWIIGVICESETAVVSFWLIIFNPVEARRLSVTPLNLLVLYSRCHAYVANTHEWLINTDLPTATRKWIHDPAVDCSTERKQWVKHLLPSWRYCQQRFCSSLLMPCTDTNMSGRHEN